jgi:TonB family protein
MQLADALGVQLSTGEKAFSVVNRDELRKLAQHELLSVDSQTYVPNSRWLASQLRADAVVIGEILKVQDNSLELSVRIFRPDDSRKKVLSVKGELHLDLSKVDLTRIDDLSGTPPGTTFNGETLYHAGKDSTYPSCTYMPNPPFTEEARRTSVSGTIVLEAIVATDGRLKNIRVIRGLPAGLNENWLKTLATWRCKPATSEGKPVASIVNFQINFRLYSR